ncbi:MAG: NAD(P)H-dependent oxidoreductase subunit E [Candidatus Zixiibacteriota bacterium]|nr:MAG: NAD(P)H-dependent oxidoreductase subunit E [candidate division Zixibacteria bacterium]
MNHDLSKLQGIFDRYPRQQESLISVLQDIQKEYQFLPCEALQETAKVLDVPLSKVFSVSTFYNAFSLHPRGDKVIRICVGTTCHIRGAALIQEQLENELKIKSGETTPDMKFSIETVSCVGACAKAPVVIVNERYFGPAKVSDYKKLLKGK